MTIAEVFGKNVTYTLEDKGMTQTRLAELTGLERSHLNRLVHGQGGPSLYTAFVIAKVLDVTIDMLLEGFNE